MSLAEPIVEGAYYLREDLELEERNEMLERILADRAAKAAEVVAELRQCEHGSSNPYMAGIAVGYNNAADLVAEKLGVKP